MAVFYRGLAALNPTGWALIPNGRRVQYRSTATKSIFSIITAGKFSSLPPVSRV
jgi:hypothetical protein